MDDFSFATPTETKNTIPTVHVTARSNSPVGPGQRLRNRIQTKLQSEHVQKRKEQAGNALKNFGSQLQKINLGKLIDQMEQDQGLADSLEQLNERMKEECQRHEIRREAEVRSLEVIQDHLDVFLQEYPNGTYEDWIADLHPENANQGALLPDIQEIDARFYVYESDHRRLWNEAMAKLEGNEHRQVAARTQIWGKALPGGTTDGSRAPRDQKAIDLISGSVEFKTNDSDNNNTNTKTPADFDFEFFAPAQLTEANQPATYSMKENDSTEDLIKF